MNKSIITYIITLLCVGQVWSQSHIRFNNFRDNLYLVNPASINDSYMGEVSMGARKQWVNFPGAPTTGFASATLYLEDYYTQFGLKVVADKIGYTTTNEVDASYAYALMLNSRWQLNMGISLSFQNLSYDVGEIMFQWPDDPIIYSQLWRENNINTDIGFELSNYNWKIGASSQNLFSLFMPANEIFPNTNILYGLYRTQTQDYIDFSFGLSGFQFVDLFQMEMSFSGIFNTPTLDNAFQLGVLYRTWNEMGALLGIHFDRLRIYYSYDFNVGQIYRHSLGTHEIMLSYKFNRTYRCRNCWY